MNNPEKITEAFIHLMEEQQDKDNIEVKFPLSGDDQMKYFIDKRIDTNGTFYDIYKINGKYYDELSNEITDYKNEIEEDDIDE